MTVLELDVGNTRLKWRVTSGLSAVSGDILRLDRSDADVVAELCGAITADAIERVCVASVADVEFSRALSAAVTETGLPVPEFACVTAEASGVVCGYADVSRLGVDRWLAVLAAHHTTPNGAVVVDCGSAITVDVVSGGCHLGGYIVPGLRLMVDALFQGTDRVKVSRRFDGELSPADDTVEAVNRGVVQMVVGLVAQAVRQWPGAVDRIPVLLTGGDAAQLRQALECEIAVADIACCPDLVMDGLRYCNTRPLDC